MSARPGIIVQARTGSTRLPGKVLKEIQGMTLLGHLLERLKRCRRTDLVVVATTTRPEDAAILEEAERHGARTFTGSQEDVLSRYLGAATAHQVDPVGRVTSDCPLSEPSVIDAAFELFLGRKDRGDHVDVVTNGRPGRRTYPRGLDVEVVSLAALRDADSRMGPEAPEREHVTQYLYRNPDRYSFDDLVLPYDLSFLRWTVDTAEDFEFVRRVYDDLYPAKPDFGLHDVLALLGRRPDLIAINLHVRQKEA